MITIIVHMFGGAEIDVEDNEEEQQTVDQQ